MEKVYDYIVVGSGFGGSVASLRLSEKGKWYDPDDFPKTNWNLRKYIWLPIFGFFGIQKLTFNRKASILSGVGVYLDEREEERDPYFNGQDPPRKPCIECAGCRIECNHSQYIVHARSSTRLFRRKPRKFRSKGLILAGGSLGTLELLLKQKYKYKTLAGLSDTLGSSLLTNSETLCAVSRIPEKKDKQVYDAL